jgi:uncharacterized membrane protein YeaQ/YmgE (transglycosylase-associated protein family)
MTSTDSQMRPQAQVFIIIMLVGLLIGGIATLSDKGRGLVTYLFLGVVGSGVGGALLVPLFGVQLINADPIVATIHFCSAHICRCDANSFEPAARA